VAVATVDHRIRPAAYDGVLGIGCGAVRQRILRPLDAGFGSVGVARETTRTVLHRWGAEALLDDLAVVVSELVTNALRHGVGLRPVRPRTVGPGQGFNHARRSPGVRRDGRVQGLDRPGRRGDSSDDSVDLVLVLTTSTLVCAVGDPSFAPPTPRPPDVVEGSGWGLHLIDSLSLSWGWRVVPEHIRPTGKVVWAVFALPSMSSQARAIGRAGSDTSPIRFDRRPEGTFSCGFDARPDRAAPYWQPSPRLASPA